MKSVIFAERDRVELREVPTPELADPNGIRVRVTATSICGSDLHLVAGHVTPEVGYALGHEWVGIVDEVGANVTKHSVGDRVTGPAAPWCGSCDLCLRGQAQRCRRGGVHGSGEMMGNLGGTQSEYLVVPWADNAVIAVPPTVSDAAALVVGDALCTGWTAVRHVMSNSPEVLVVIGCGPVGLSAIMTAVASGVPEVIAVDRVAERLAVAEKVGATRTFLADDAGKNQLRELYPEGVPAVVDAAGTQGSLDLASDIIGIGGLMGNLGIPAHPLTVNFGALMLKNPTLWTGLGDLTHMSEAIDLVASGKIDPLPIFSHTIDLGGVAEMYARMASGEPGILKVLVTP